MEQWKVIPGFEGYEISSFGRVKGKQTNIMHANSNAYGYMWVNLYKNGGYHKRYIHRLVAESFVDNPNKLNEVDHIDNNPSNNNYLNLRWVTHKENMKHSQVQHRAIWKPESHEKAIESMKRRTQKKVVGICILDGKETRYKGVNETIADGFQPSCVSNCCNGIRATHGGYIWRFDED